MEDNNGNTTYTYIVQVCGDAGGVPGAGVVQIENTATGKKSTVVGVYDATQVFGGSKSLQECLPDFFFLFRQNVSHTIALV